MANNRVSLVPIDLKIEERINSLGGRPLNLYQALAHHPVLLSAWVEFAYTLRKGCTVSRSLRELMILRGAQIAESQYEWQQHEPMALSAGVSREKIEALVNWKESQLYSVHERLAIELMESIMEGRVSQELFLRVRKEFSESEWIELIMTGSFYAMVPRVLDGLGVPLEK
jgi:alkylhydroperoxidase family enzyme